MFRTLYMLIVFLSVTVPVCADLFQDSNDIIIIRSDTEEFLIASNEFPFYEPTYEAPPDGSIRIWTDDYYCLQQDGTQYGDPFFTPERFITYVENIAAYQAAYEANQVPDDTVPVIYVDVALSKDTLDINDSSDKIQFQAWIRDDAGNVLPLTSSWIIRLRDATGNEVDAIKIHFVNGETSVKNYTTPKYVPCGRIHVDESDFDMIDIPGVGMFQVRLLAPVEITIYREL